MKLQTEFVEIALENLHREAAIMKAEGWRFIETHAVNTDNGVDLYYAFMKDGLARNLKIVGVTKDDAVPSITDMFLAAFVFENEARELFGVDMKDIAIDFAGTMYAPAISEPMTIMTPEQKAAREKARKAAAAKASKEEASAGDDAAAPSGAGHVFVMTPERRQRLDAKLATMSPEKVAKVEAALKAREAEAAAAASGAGTSAAKPEPKQAEPEQSEAKAVESAEAEPVDAVLESKIALLDAEKAARVRAVLNGGQGVEPVSDEPSEVEAGAAGDGEIEAKLSGLDADKAAKVRAALAAARSRENSMKGGE